MKAVVFYGPGDIRVSEEPDPKLQQRTDAVVRLTASAICGTDLHMVRGTMPGMEPGTILGHEGVGIVEQLGPDVRNLRVGDRVVISSTIACGTCSYCRAGYFAHCDQANPNGPRAGTAFFGGPKTTGPFNGLQAERARVPYANVGLVKLPDEVSDEQAIMLSDIVPTGYFGADLAEIRTGDTRGDNWHPGDAPSLALSWAVETLAKAGTLGIIGVYPDTARTFPIGMAMNKNLTVKMGNCHHRRYIPMLIDFVRRGTLDPAKILTQAEPLTSAIEAYKAFDTRQPGWMKVKLEPSIARAKAS
jgi:threonine dehydrogenase-like Zn-dependent dehydrogenase